MNKKGFTLVELLVMLVVLGILIGITVPNIAGILKDNRKSMSYDDASRMIENAKVRASLDEKALPENSERCTILRLKYLDRNNDFKTGPNKGRYNKDESFVLIKLNVSSVGSRETLEYTYYARLVEEKDDKNIGIKFATEKQIADKDSDVFSDNISLIGITSDMDLTDYTNKEMIEENVGIECLGIENDLNYKQTGS